MKQPHKQTLSKDYKTTSFVLLTIAFFVFFAIRPSITLIFTLQKEKTEYQKINNALETKIQNIMQTQSKYMQLLEKKNLIDEAIPNEAIPNSNEIKKYNDLLNKKVSIQEFSINDFQILPPKEKGLNKIIIDLSRTGSYADISDFIFDIYHIRRLFSITQIDIEKNTTSTESAVLNLNTILNTYYYANNYE